MANMTEAALLEALRKAMQRKPTTGDGFTIRELSVALNQNARIPIGPFRVTETVRALIENGLAETVRVQRPAMDNTIRNVPGYRLIPKKKT